MTSLADQFGNVARADGCAGGAAGFAPATTILTHIDHCPRCRRPIDARCTIEQGIPLTKVKYGDVVVLAWCPACALGFRGYFRDDGTSRMMTRFDRLEREDADAVRVRKHHETESTTIRPVPKRRRCAGGVPAIVYRWSDRGRADADQSRRSPVGLMAFSPLRKTPTVTGGAFFRPSLAVIPDLGSPPPRSPAR